MKPYIFCIHIIWAYCPYHSDHLDPLDHLDHLDHPDHPGNPDHLDHIEKLDHLDHLDHPDHPDHLDYLDHQINLTNLTNWSPRPTEPLWQPWMIKRFIMKINAEFALFTWSCLPYFLTFLLKGFNQIKYSRKINSCYLLNLDLMVCKGMR